MKMSHLKGFFYFILFHVILATPQLNLYNTDEISESDNELQHNCFRLVSSTKQSNDYRRIISYCLSHLPSNFHLNNNDIAPKFTFAELSKQNVTSEQLYLWSAPMDLIERYQFYLNQLSTSNRSLSVTDVFYNCTIQRFGPLCQYEFVYLYLDQSPLYEIIEDFYRTYEYDPTTLTCYTHLKCNRGPSPMCLDWTEICNGRVDCLDDGADEEYCWQLEINECEENEYRCKNGQCIPKSFYFDNDVPACMDQSDSAVKDSIKVQLRNTKEPSFEYEDMTCADTFLTSSCIGQRRELLLEMMFSFKDNSVSEKCWSAIKCILYLPGFKKVFCDEFCVENGCIEIIENTCPDIFYFPNVPFFFGQIYLAYNKSDILYLSNFMSRLPYMCYNSSRYNDYFLNVSMILFKNTTCFRPEVTIFSTILSDSWVAAHHPVLHRFYEALQIYNPIMNYTTLLCNKPDIYQCINSSKCISIYRLKDNNLNCPHGDDENIIHMNNTRLLEIKKETYFKCESTDTYIPQIQVENSHCDCGYIELDWCEDENLEMNIVRRNISFQTICDGFVELVSVPIEDRNETDETECQQWECNNIYTRCNGIWNCPNGADEAGCMSLSLLNCSSQHHLCVSPNTNQLMCLSIDKMNDGKINCLGATDEPLLCRSRITHFEYRDQFHCKYNNSQRCLDSYQLCNQKSDCEDNDDEQFCGNHSTIPIFYGICQYGLTSNSDIENFICERTALKKKDPLIYFLLDGLVEVAKNFKNDEKKVFSNSSTIKMLDQHVFRCHRGLDVRIWLNITNNLSTNTCLCPPSYYGDQCQYQNQRISLNIKFHAFADSWQTLFVVIISLIDNSDQRIIHSYEQFTYLSMRDCQTKFKIYLLYSTRPKDPMKQYTIHIDFYEKLSLNYRGSVLLPVKFSFLPVHRLSFIVDIPRSDNKTQRCYNDRCIHGQCIKYSNNLQNLTFCQCKEGWSGRYCTIQHTCTCSSDSLCIGISANKRSICVCPQNKFGPRCLLADTICQNENNSTCQNGGQCVPNDGYLIFNRTFTCICRKGYSGDRCEIADNKLILSFNKDIILSQSLFIHFIEVLKSKTPIRSTIFQTIPLQKDAVTIRWPRRFHLVFTELAEKTYYITVLQTTYNQSTTIDKIIHPSDRCLHIRELFNETFVQWHLVRRIKYYHLPCQQKSLNLSCFYDDVHLCLCYTFGEKRLANCFNFDHNMTFDCFGQSECENNGQCLQDTLECPTRSMCICQPCFYGRRCQFSTSGFGLSLDAIIGYHILPDVSVPQQPAIVRFTLALTTIFMVTGLINAILCMITFKNKSVREVGCGLYLLGSSITTLFITIMFGLKFLILILAQMTIISNRSFLSFQCHSIDFILRSFLSMDQWLNACVAVERATTVIKAARFNKKKSKQTAKIVIVILLFVIIGSCVHEPIYRRLIDEGNNDDDNNDVKRIWCVVTYPSSLQIYNSAIDILHFFGPFIINLVSAVILITKKSRQKISVQTQRSYREILRLEFQQHKHLLTAPVVLVILALPRLIITFVSICMKSSNDAWLFLILYFISFVPPMLTFVVFILPSEFYRKEFRKTLQQYRMTIQQRFNFIS